MTPDELLRLYPRETLRWLRGRLGLSQEAFAELVDVRPQTVATWEARRHAITTPNRGRIALHLAPHLATPEGEDFARSLGRGKASEM